MRGNSLPSQRIARHRIARGGFTLPELLVVIFCIAVLATILIPVVSKSRQAATRTKCANVLRGLGHAVTSFSSEHNGTLPTCGTKTTTAYPNSTDWIVWGGMDTTTVGTVTRNNDYMEESGLAKYLGVTSIDTAGAPNEALRNNFRCPAVDPDLRATKPYPYDYQFNAQLSGMPIDRVDRAGQKGVIVETDGYDDSAYCYYDPKNPRSPATYNNGDPNSIQGGKDSPSSRHGGRGDNCLFADGHVDILTNNDFQTWDAYYTPGTPDTATQTQNTTYGNAR